MTSSGFAVCLPCWRQRVDMTGDPPTVPPADRKMEVCFRCQRDTNAGIYMSAIAYKTAFKPAGCDCGRPEKGWTCRCTCPKCGSRKLRWNAVGHYLDKDLVCQSCETTVDIWNC